MSLPHDPAGYRLCLDSSKLSFKAVLLDNGNIYPSIPVDHVVHMKETNEYIKELLESIKYTDLNGKFVLILKILPYS